MFTPGPWEIAVIMLVAGLAFLILGPKVFSRTASGAGKAAGEAVASYNKSLKEMKKAYANTKEELNSDDVTPEK